MPTTHFCLFQGTSYSLKDEKYDIKIYSKYKLTAGGTTPMIANENRPITFGELFLNYDTSEQDKYSTIIASKLEIEAWVGAGTDGTALSAFMKFLRDTWEEGDITIAVFRNSQVWWAGTILIDLGDEEDVVEPYSVKLTATDGLGLLKNYDMVSVQSTNPYEAADTYLSVGYQNIIYWLTKILGKCRTPNLDSTSQDVDEWELQASVKWAYLNMNLGANDCVLEYTNIQMLGTYALQEGTPATYKAPTVYYVLDTICKMFNARIIYWAGDFYFTQINEFNIPEQGSAGNPINIFTSSYSSGASFLNNRENINKTLNFGAYEQDISFGNTGGLQRLSVGNFTYEPQVKRVECIFDSFVGNEAYYQGFPEVWTPAEVNNSTGDQEHTTTLGTHYNAFSFGGFICKFPIDIQVTNPAGFTNFVLRNFHIRARAVGNVLWDKYLAYGGVAGQFGEWKDYPLDNGGFLDWNYEYTSTDPQWWAQCGWMVSSWADGNHPESYIFDQTIVTHADFIGDWEFEICMHGRRQVFPGATSLAYYFMGVDMFMDWPNPPAPTTFSPIYEWGENGFEFTWTDSMDNTTVPATYMGLFQPYSQAGSNTGSSSGVTNIYTDRTDTEIKKVEPIIWGDTIAYGESNSILFSDANGVAVDGYTDPNGLWSSSYNSAAFDETLTELICQDRLNNQAISSSKMNCTLATSIVNPNTSFGVEIMVTPIGVLNDTNDGIVYQFQRGTYNLNTDEVEGEWIQINREIIAGTTTNTGGGTTTGGGGTPSSSAMMIPNGFTAPVLNSKNSITAGTITSIVIDPYAGSLNILKAGDIIEIALMNGNGALISFKLAANVNTNDTSISVVSQVTYLDIPAGSPMRFSTQDIIMQSMRKTHGQVAGFNIDADGIEKNGIEITSWLDSDSMNGATANNVPTAESVKAYVDGSSGVLKLFSMITCSATTQTSLSDGVANAVVMKFDIEKISYGSALGIVVYGINGVEEITDSEYCVGIKFSAFQRYFEFLWNVSANTNGVNNRLLSGIRIQEGVISGSAMIWTTIEPTTSYIYDRGAGNIRKGSGGGSVIIDSPISVAFKYYRMQFWREKGTNAGTDGVSVLDGTQLSIKQIA